MDLHLSLSLRIVLCCLFGLFFDEFSIVLWVGKSLIGGIWEKLETILPGFYQQSYFSLRFHICQLNVCICSFTILLIICNGVYICICICTCICICNNVPLTKNCSGIYERICKSLVWVSALWVHQNFKMMKFCLKWHLKLQGVFFTGTPPKVPSTKS